MRKLIVLFTLLLMSSSAFATTYYLTSQSYNWRTQVRTCNYSGGHVRTVRAGSRCPSKIVIGIIGR